MDEDEERSEAEEKEGRSRDEERGPEGAGDSGESPSSSGETPESPKPEAEAPAEPLAEGGSKEPAEAQAPEGAPEAETPAAPVAAGEPTKAQAPEAAPEAKAPVVEPSAEPAAERGAEEPTKAQAPGLAPELAVALSAAIVLVALVAFIVGFAAHAMLDEDDGGGGAAAGAAGGSGDSAAAAAAADDDPFWGPEDAAVTIVEYSDFQCPFCKRFFDETLPQIRDTYEDKVRFIYRDFPLTAIHPYAQKAAEAAQCAHEQDLFWDYHDLVFENQDALTVDDLKGYAQQVGADTGEFNDCLDSGKNAREVALDLQDGRQDGISGTPGFVINGLLVSGAQPFEAFQAVIDQALATEGQ